MTITFIDLFSGCGGISLGFKWAGLHEISAIDFDRSAIKVFKANFPENKHVYCEDLRSFGPKLLSEKVGVQEVDIVVGGPPCQGFSTVRQRDGSNSGSRLVADSRRDLYKEFLKYVSFFKPKIFVMENVPGIKTAAGGHFYSQVQSEARDLGYSVHSEVVNAWEYGVPQKRIRRLIIGTEIGLPFFTLSRFVQKTHDKNNAEKQQLVTLWEAIGDLPPIPAGGGADHQEYDLELRKKQVDKYTGRYIFDVLDCDKSEKLADHKARPHSARDLRDFSRLLDGENSEQAIKRGESMEFPYDRNSFKDRYTRQSKDGLSSTILAHLSKDGLMFIHPVQNRSLTPREAARIQSFPDTFQLPVSRTDQFRLIGNAVPPLVGFALGNGISRWMTSIEFTAQNNKGSENLHQDVEALTNMLAFGEKQQLSEIPPFIFLLGWKSIHSLFPNLHPSSAFENGDSTYLTNSYDLSQSPGIILNTLRLRYLRSGWPVILVPYAKEAKRRYDINSLSETDYYWNN